MYTHLALQEFEIFISPEQYAAAGIAHLHLPTIDFLYAPPVGEMHRGVDFIHGASSLLTILNTMSDDGRAGVWCGQHRSVTGC